MSILNAKTELLAIIKAKKKTLLCAVVENRDPWAVVESPLATATLRIGYTQEEFEKFLTELDYKYDSGYGGQEIYGTLWCTDGTWFERGEYDGSEWWELRSRPDIPEECSRGESEFEDYK